MNTTTIKTRFAPSPTGYLHLGNVRTALFNALLARTWGGRFLLRIEDTDQERSRPEYVAALLEDLRWLGLDWQEGPEIGGSGAPYAQSERAAIYAAYYHQLENSDQAYPC
ncbi:MAG: glutamate--tRNA ligase, partial [Synechococcaceae cyanobacterium SM1_2_3]|nr:glutamate--tRNA ligase [Synechococcaceae cyanobacterium SM1_2_3]